MVVYISLFLFVCWLFKLEIFVRAFEMLNLNERLASRTHYAIRVHYFLLYTKVQLLMWIHRTEINYYVFTFRVHFNRKTYSYNDAWNDKYRRFSVVQCKHIFYLRFG